LMRRPNVIGYDWELSGRRIASDYYLGQLLRTACRSALLPPESVGSIWLHALANRLNASATIISFSDPSQLALIRKSTLGFNAVELHALVDWLESSDFPLKSYTFEHAVLEP
jgi:hypothetical protein